MPEQDQNNSLGQYVYYLPGVFTTTSWSGNVSFIYNDGTLMASGKNASFSLGYNGSLTGQPGGLRILDDNRSVEFTVSFSANVTNNFKGSPLVNIIGECLNSSRITYFGSFPFAVSHRLKKYEFNATLPEGTSYAGFRIGFYGFTGSVDLSYANFTVSNVAVPTANTPFGNSVPLKNATLSLPSGFEKALVIYSVGNDIGPLVAIVSKYQNLSLFNGNVQAVILLKTGYIANLLGKYAVINEGISRADHVTIDGKTLFKYFSGNDGSYIYSLNMEGKVVILLQKNIVYELDSFYIIIIILSSFLVLAGLRPKYASTILHKLVNNMKSMKIRKS